MLLPQVCRELLKEAEGKALATYHPDGGVNVVPVSSIFIEEENIILVNYFFSKTLHNVQVHPDVSLAAWKGLRGCQVKATAVYETEGERFTTVVQTIKHTLPDRVVKGIFVLTPTKFYDVSAGTKAGKELI